MRMFKTPHAKAPSATKSGPGRYHKQGHSHKKERVKEPGGYGKGLAAAWTRARKLVLEQKAK